MTSDLSKESEAWKNTCILGHHLICCNVKYIWWEGVNNFPPKQTLWWDNYLVLNGAILHYSKVDLLQRGSTSQGRAASTTLSMLLSVASVVDHLEKRIVWSRLIHASSGCSYSSFSSCLSCNIAKNIELFTTFEQVVIIYFKDVWTSFDQYLSSLSAAKWDGLLWKC